MEQIANDTRFYWGNSIDRIVPLCLDNYKDEAESCIRQADLICENTFVFREHWEMERTHVPYTFEGEIKWSAVPFGDQEWTFALNRHTAFWLLGKAWRYTKDLRYGEHFVRLINDWIDREPLTEESRKNTWRSLEAGIRVEYWIKSLKLFAGCPLMTRELKEKIEASLRLHGTYLMSIEDDFHRISNWGVLESHGLLLLGLWFQDKEWTDTAVKRLKEEAHYQVFADGTQWEQSPMYHGEVLHGLLDSLVHLKRFGLPIPGSLAEAVKKMLFALAAWSKPNGHMPCQSDSDDIDTRDLLVQGAVFYESGELKYLAGEKWFEENMWNCGMEGKGIYDSIEAIEPECASCALTDSGNYFLKTGFGEMEDYIHFHCGCMGSGHGHGDQLHVDYYSHGEDILIDSGRYTYVDSDIRRNLKFPSAHNTVVMDKQEFCTYINSWAYGPMALPVKGEYVFRHGLGFVSGAHFGYIKQGMVPMRKVVMLDKGLLLVADIIYGTGKHAYTSYLHFGKQARVSLDGNTGIFQGEKAQARIFCLKGETELSKEPVSTEYNLLEDSFTLKNHLIKEDTAAFYTVIAVSGAGQDIKAEAELLPVTMARSGRTLPPEEGEAVRIRKNGREYVVILCHEELVSEVDLFTAGGHKSYGKLMVFTPERPEGVVLQY